MQRLHVLLIMALVMMSCRGINERLDAIDNRLDQISNTQIASLQEQIDSITATLPQLQQASLELKDYIAALQSTSANLEQRIEALESEVANLSKEVEEAKNNTDGDLEYAALEQRLNEALAMLSSLNGALLDVNSAIESLLLKDADIEASIDVLREYVDGELLGAKDWATATFATLEHYNTLVGYIVDLRTRIDAITTTLEEADVRIEAKISTSLAALEESMKGWVNELLTGYYTIAEVDALLGLMRESMREENEALDEEMDMLALRIDAMHAELTAAYAKAIEEAINNYGGAINTQITNAINAVNVRVDAEVAAINIRLESLEKRIKELEDALDKIRALDIIFDVTEDLVCHAGSSVDVGYTIVGGDDETEIECFGNGGWSAAVIKKSNHSGVIKVTAPADAAEGKVVVLATSGAGGVVMKSLYFTEGILTDVRDRYNVGWEASTLAVVLKTNLDYIVNIPEHAAGWLSVADTRASLRTETLLFTIAENPYDMPRMATIELVNDCGYLLRRFDIVQELQPAEPPVIVGSVSVSRKSLGYYRCGDVSQYDGFAHFAAYADMALLPVELVFSAEEHGAYAWSVIDSAMEGAWSDAQCIEYLMRRIDTNAAPMERRAYAMLHFDSAYEFIAIVLDSEGLCSELYRESITTALANAGDAAEYVAWWSEGEESDEPLDPEVPEEPAEPTPLETPNVTCEVVGNSATIRWQEVAGAKNYTVKLSNGSEQLVITNYVTYNDLDYDSAYSVIVIANPLDAALYSASEMGVSTFVTEAAPDEGDDDEGGGEDDDNVSTPDGYIAISSCSYIGDYGGIGVSEEFVLRSVDGRQVLYFNINSAIADPNYIKSGEYAIAKIGESGLRFNMSKLSGTTIINGVSYYDGISDNSGSTLSVVSSGKGGVHELRLTLNTDQGVLKYYFQGLLTRE